MRLKAFSPVEFNLNFAAKLNGRNLNLKYTWDKGSLTGLPSLHQKVGERKVGLWEDTCFEFFLGQTNHARYFEINIAPSGEWNSFVFDKYREAPLTVASELNLKSFNLKENSIEVELELPSELLGKRIEANATAVLPQFNGREKYWALSHPHLKPDFHAREQFIYNF